MEEIKKILYFIYILNFIKIKLSNKNYSDDNLLI